jgi:hypothetical protein
VDCQPPGAAIGAPSPLRFELPHGCTPCPAGIQCASKYLAVPGDSELFDVLPQSLLHLLNNPEIFCGAVAFDAWLGNTDYRQFVFRRVVGVQGYTAFMVDQGDCFNRTKWNFPDLQTPLALSVVPSVKMKRCGTLAPWVTAIESITADDVERATADMPEAWTRGQSRQLRELISHIVARTRTLRTLLATSMTMRQIIRGVCLPNPAFVAFPT